MCTNARLMLRRRGWMCFPRHFPREDSVGWVIWLLSQPVCTQWCTRLLVSHALATCQHSVSPVVVLKPPVSASSGELVKDTGSQPSPKTC